MRRNTIVSNKLIAMVTLVTVTALLAGVAVEVGYAGPTWQNMECPWIINNFLCPAHCAKAGLPYSCLGQLPSDYKWQGGSREACYYEECETCTELDVGCPVWVYTSFNGTCTGDRIYRNYNCWKICGT